MPSIAIEFSRFLEEARNMSLREVIYNAQRIGMRMEQERYDDALNMQRLKEFTFSLRNNLEGSKICSLYKPIVDSLIGRGELQDTGFTYYS